MGFPFSIRQEFYVPEKFFEANRKYEDVLREFYIRNLEENNSVFNVAVENGIVNFQGKALFGIKNSIRVSISTNELETRFIYDSDLTRFLKIILVSIVVLSFSTLWSVTLYLWMAGILSLVLYNAGVVIVRNENARIFESIFGKSDTNIEGSERFAGMQKNWMKNVYNCPGCGAYVSSIDVFCRECGLKVKQSKQTIPLSISRFKERYVVFDYVETDNKSESK